MWLRSVSVQLIQLPVQTPYRVIHVTELFSLLRTLASIHVMATTDDKTVLSSEDKILVAFLPFISNLFSII